MPRAPHHHAVFLGGPGVRYEELAPPPPLAPWVAVCWQIVGQTVARLLSIEGSIVGISYAPWFHASS